MLNIFSEMLSYEFLARAIVVGLLVSLCSSLLGASLVLKRYSMLGDGLSHVGFGALAVASVFNLSPLAVALPVVVVASVLLLRLGESVKIKGDAAIALISTGSLASGVLIISLKRGMNSDILNYLFGSILTMTSTDVLLSAIVSAVVIVLFIIFYNSIFAVTFDESFSRAVGTRAGIYNTLLAVLTAATIALGMRMMGAMLISALLILPALTSMRLCRRFRSVIICSAAVAVCCFLAGAALSYKYSLPTGASVVMVGIAAFLLASLAERIRAALMRRKTVPSQ